MYLLNILTLLIGVWGLWITLRKLGDSPQWDLPPKP